MSWITLRLETTTPVFNGGADPTGSLGLRPSPEAGIRVASIRGAMRFWLRALAGIAVGEDLKLLAAIEQRVLGGIVVSSPIKLRIARQPRLSTEVRPGFVRDKGRGDVCYMLGLGLCDKGALIRPYVPAGQSFELKLRFAGDDPAAQALAIAALWLTCTYGGIGARVRRGFGGVRIVGASDGLPRPWEPHTVLTPELDYYDGLKSLWPAAGGVADCMSHLKTVVRDLDQEFKVAGWQEPPTYPVLDKKYTKAITGTRAFDSWHTVLEFAGRQLRGFRTDGGQHTPEWDNVIQTEMTTHFGLGALGLPVVFHDKDEDDTWIVNADHGEGPDASERRRASPLWLRPVGSGNQWRLLSFAFLGQFLPGPDAPQVHLWHGDSQGRRLDVGDSDIVERVTTWTEAARTNTSFVQDQNG